MFGKKPKGAVEKNRLSGGLMFLLAMLLGAILAVAAGVFFYLSSTFSFTPVAPANSNQALDHQVKPKKAGDADNVEYEFYDILPKQNSVVVPEMMKDSNANADNDTPRFRADVVINQPKPEKVTVADLDSLVAAQVQANQTANASKSDQNANLANDKINPKPTVKAGDQVEAKSDSPKSPQRTDLEKLASQVPELEIEEIDIGSSVDSSAHVKKFSDKILPKQIEKTEDKSEKMKITAVKDVKPAPAVTYILQINTYDNPKDADDRKAQVLMAGVDAFVVKKNASSGVVYQVVSRPTVSKEAIAKAQRDLQNNGIDALVIEQRRRD